MTGDATVITSNLDVTGNIFMRGNKFIVESETKLINDAIIGIANNNTVSTTDKGIIMQNTTGNVAIIHHGTGDGFADQLTFGYTADPLDTVTVTNDLTKELTVNVLGNVITQNNLSIGGLLKINTISAASSHSLQAVTNLGNVTSNTVQFSNAITSLVASSNIVATGNVSAGRDTDTTSYFGRAAVGYMGTSDQASFAHFDRNSSAQYALKQTAVGATTINTPATQHIRFTVNDGNAGAEKMRITSAGNVGIGVSAPDANLHVEGNVYVSSNLTASGNVAVDTDTLFVDSVNDRVGVGTNSPNEPLDIYGAGMRIHHLGGEPKIDFLRGGTNRTPSGALNTFGAANYTDWRIGASGANLKFQQQYIGANSGNIIDVMTMNYGTGNVGVGTDAPGTALEVFSTSGTQMTLRSNSRYSTIFAVDDTGSSFFGNDRGNIRFVAGGDTSGTGASEKMRILANGNVGIGTVSPAKKLHVEHYGSQIGDFEGIRIANHATNLHATSRPAYEFVVSDINAGTGIGNGKFAIGYRGNTSASRTDRLVIDNSGRVGISRSDPTYTLDVFGNVGICNTTSGKTDQHWSYSGGTDSNTGNMYLRYGASGYTAAAKTRVRGSDANMATLNFTGQHKTYIKDISSERAEELEGLIVSANTNKYMKMSEGVEMGQNAITINESLPIVNISNVSRDKTCFGVISASEDSNDTRGETIGCFTAFIHKEDGDTRVYINSLGEGALWVVNTNGTIESGDYVTTSNIAGYGMKQDSECLMNYTVAKSTMDCDFNPLTQKKRRIVKEQRDAVAWVLRKYEEVSEEEYTNAPEDKRKIEDGTFKIEREYVSRHDPDNEDYIKETRTLEFSVLDENKQLVWEDMDDSELEYKIRYLDANGNITTEENATHKAAFIGCTYHCG
jgi:hypothetical protein